MMFIQSFIEIREISKILLGGKTHRHDVNIILYFLIK
jgi:hypothetical protein